MSKMNPAAELNLLNAVIKWCDTELIEAARRAEAACTVTALANYRGPRLLRDRELRPGTARDWMLQPVNPHQNLDAAWEQIRRHWCRHIETGDLIVSGFKLAFSGNPIREVLPGIFATAMTFSFGDNQVAFGAHTYTHVLVTPAERDVAEYTPRPSANAVVDDAAARADAVDPDVGRAKKTRGQSSLDPLIREAVDAKWSSVCVDGKRADSWSAMARWLEKHLRDKYQRLGSETRLPSHGTIRTRLPRIYNDKLAAINA